MTLLLTICLLHFAAQLTPGPDILLIVRTAATDHIYNSLKVVAGISVGIAAWVCLTLLGFSVLIQQWPWLQQLMMLCGGAFLAKMGYTMVKEGWLVYQHKKKDIQFATTQSSPIENGVAKTSAQYFLLGLYTNLTNPKTLIYFSSVFSLALSSTASPYLKLQLAAIIPLQTFATFSVLAWVLSREAIQKKYQVIAHGLDMISGILFLSFAVILWIDMLHMGF